ncbi:hypothetical protein ACF0H5_022435 [Mactra antiquata]
MAAPVLMDFLLDGSTCLDGFPVRWQHLSWQISYEMAAPVMAAFYVGLCSITLKSDPIHPTAVQSDGPAMTWMSAYFNLSSELPSSGYKWCHNHPKLKGQIH